MAAERWHGTENEHTRTECQGNEIEFRDVLFKTHLIWKRWRSVFELRNNQTEERDARLNGQDGAAIQRLTAQETLRAIWLIESRFSFDLELVLARRHRQGEAGRENDRNNDLRWENIGGTALTETSGEGEAWEVLSARTETTNRHQLHSSLWL